ELYGGDYPQNSIPGTLTGWTIDIDATSESYPSIDFGVSCLSGLCSDRVLTSLAQQSIATNQLMLRHFTGVWGDYMSIAEIKVYGDGGVFIN
ncbi:MAG: hypothetical protein HY753_06350, partial [Nitrospirae bacterium]|nr:hypothetical protein [Nitrospirota bacterium]